MSHIRSVHTILDLNDWDFFSLKNLLTFDSSSVNEIDETMLTPLHRVLMDRRCSPGIVKLLIQHGADVNLLPNDGCSPLITALSRRLDKEIISALLDGGIDHNRIQERGEFVLCSALFHGNPADVFKMLVDAGCALQGCSFHPSIFHCALESQQTPLDTDLLRLLLERCPDADMNLLSGYGQSLLCLALSGGKGVTVAKMLMDAGCSTDVCRRHASLWVCATSYSSMLTLETAKLVASRCGHFDYVNEVGENPLQLALKYGNYEMGAIRLLLELQTGDINNVRSHSANTVLHDATSNCLAKPGAVKLLIERGAQVNVVNRSGDTPLHTAVACENYQQAIVKILIENGASVNLENRACQTPLYIAVQKGVDSSTLQLLLSTAARIKAETHWDSPSLRWVLGQYDSFDCNDNINCCKLFLKYALLDDPNIDIKDLALRIWPRVELLEFANKCANELHRMKFINVACGLSLFEFIWRCFYRESGDRNFELQLGDCDLINLLQVLEDNEFHVYLDAVAANIGRRTMEAQLQSVMVYTVISSLDAPSVVKRIILNYESVCHLVSFLNNDEDVLRLILAYHG